MTFDAFSKKLKQTITPDDEIDTSPDFQCDQTGGYPTMLCVCWEKNVAWLELRYDLADEGLDLCVYEQGVADFGIRQCCDIEQYNDLLKDLGEDAYDMAYIPPEEEINEMTLGGM